MKVVIKRRLSGIMFLVLALALGVAAGCKKNDNTGNNANSGNTTGNKIGTLGGGSTTSDSGGPTAALKAYYEAANRKDVQMAKRYLSQGTMRLLEEGAQRMGKSVDEALKEGSLQSPQLNPEFSNEKITGDTATVDIKAEGQTITMPMVKEGGEWKLAMDKLIENMKNQMSGPGTQVPPPTGADNDEDEHGGHDEK